MRKLILFTLFLVVFFNMKASESLTYTNISIGDTVFFNGVYQIKENAKLIDKKNKILEDDTEALKYLAKGKYIITNINSKLSVTWTVDFLKREKNGTVVDLLKKDTVLKAKYDRDNNFVLFNEKMKREGSEIHLVLSFFCNITKENEKFGFDNIIQTKKNKDNEAFWELNKEYLLDDLRKYNPLINQNDIIKSDINYNIKDGNKTAIITLIVKNYLKQSDILKGCILKKSISNEKYMFSVNNNKNQYSFNFHMAISWDEKAKNGIKAYGDKILRRKRELQLIYDLKVKKGKKSKDNTLKIQCPFFGTLGGKQQ